MSNLKLILEPHFTKSTHRIHLGDNLFFIGSCFSENISSLLSQRKLNILSNPSGILFDILSIERTIREIADNKEYGIDDLYKYNELYLSWNHHTSFSSLDPALSIASINNAIKKSHHYLQSAQHVFITLGSAFSYYHTAEKKWVANCHKVPQTIFEKTMLDSDAIFKSLENIYMSLLFINPNIKCTLTISPVRHLRDGVIDNNRSKARLIDAVHSFTKKYGEVYYFPSYEIVIDVLRDYRFYDIDYAHPNYLATQVVYDYFRDLCIEASIYSDLDKFYQLNIATQHRAKHKGTHEHKLFLSSHVAKTKELIRLYPQLNFDQELNYFESELRQLEIGS